MKLNDKTMIARVYKLTQNVQDAEDAVQEAYLYQLTHKLKRKHFLWKALNVAKTTFRDRTYFCNEDGHEGIFESNLETLMAKDEYDKLYERLSKTNRRLIHMLLEHGGKSAEAAKANNIDVSHFKRLLHRLRYGEIG